MCTKLSRESARSRVTCSLRNFSKHYAGRPTRRKMFANLVKVLYVSTISSFCISVKSNVPFFVSILAHDLFSGTAKCILLWWLWSVVNIFFAERNSRYFRWLRRRCSIIRNEHIYRFFGKYREMLSSIFFFWSFNQFLVHLSFRYCIIVTLSFFWIEMKCWNILNYINGFM